MERCHCNVLFARVETSFAAIWEKLQEAGFLLESDPRLPSVCTLVTGEPLRSSWWSHPLAHAIFALNSQLQDHPDIIITKLISGKVTFVHRNLWSEIYAIGSARETWQMKGLLEPALTLLGLVDELGSLRTDEVQLSKVGRGKIGDAARELERRLLIASAQVHTSSGAHAKFLETWATWARGLNFKPAHVAPTLAKETIEIRLNKLNEQHDAVGKLPWMKERTKVERFK